MVIHSLVTNVLQNILCSTEESLEWNEGHDTKHPISQEIVPSVKNAVII